VADNVGYTPGSGATVAADDIGGGVLAQRVKPVWGPDGTGTDVDVASGLPVQSGWKELTGSAAANNADLVSVDVSGYRWISVQVTGTFSATVAFQQSNDGITWSLAWLALPTNVGLAQAFNTTSTGLFTGPIQCRFFRLRTTAYTSGTAGAVVELSSSPSAVPPTSLSYVTGSLSVSGSGSITDSYGASTPINAASAALAYNGTNWDRLRTPTTFKSVTATASGSTALWTPGASKKFRLMRFKVDVTHDAAQSSGGDITIDLLDSASAMGFAQSVFVPGTAATTMGPGWTSGWVDLGNGKLSSTINNVLNISLSAALTSGAVRVIAAGTEE
jgi:hypothetical protein